MEGFLVPMGVYRTIWCFGHVTFLQIYQNVWENSTTIHIIIFQDTNWYKKSFQDTIYTIPIKELCKISAVKRYGNCFNFMNDVDEKVAKMSQIIQTCDFFRGQTVKYNSRPKTHSM